MNEIVVRVAAFFAVVLAVVIVWLWLSDDR
jgi:hypothetical protein